MNSKLQDFYRNPVKVCDNGKECYLEETSLRLIEAIELQRLVRESGASKTLEIGLALGASAVAITEALEQKGGTVRHSILDPFQKDFGNIGLNELKRLGLNRLVDFHPVASEDFLYECSKNGVKFDMIFNDGDHSIGNKVTSTFLSDRCLAMGGILALHDAFLHSTAACVRYLVCERGYEVLPLLADSNLKRRMRILKYWHIHDRWYAFNVVPFTSRSLVALRKTERTTL